jgi:hypothetical protein
MPSQALAEVGSGVLPREDKATAIRVLSLSGQGGDFVARGIRPSGRRGKSSNAAVAARPVRLHGR